MERKGKRAGGPGGVPLAGCGAAPRVPYRASFARHKEYCASHHAASASTKFGKSSNTHLFFNVQELAGQGDDCLAGSTPGFDLFVIPLQVWAVALRNQGTLHQRRPSQLATAFPARSVSFELEIRGTIPK